jgi:hypothetical protein
MEKKDKDSILKQMRSEMPFSLPLNCLPYIREAMDIYAKQEQELAVDKALTTYRDNLLNSGLNNDFDVLARYNEILEELRNG